LEPILALVAAAVFVLLCLGWRGVQRAQPRSPRFWIVYVAVLASSLLVAVALGHDWLYPNQVFRTDALRVALTVGVVVLPLILVLVLKENHRTGYLADLEYRGLHGRVVIPLFGVVWCVVLGLWIVTLFPHAPNGLVFAIFGAAGVLLILVQTVELVVQPRFLVPASLRNQPGRVEDWLARRERRAGAGKGPIHHRLSVPKELTVVLEKERRGGSRAWSAELDDLKATGGTVEGLVDEVARKLQARFAHPDGAYRALNVQFICYGEKAETVVSRQVLFDVSRTAEGEYSAQPAENPAPRFTGKTLEELMRTAQNIGISEAMFTWSRSIEL
jgi:hypothetical protein